MRTLTEKYFGGIPLDPADYEADFAVVDKYQAFSSELLRLSLLGIAGYGFLIANIVLKTAPKTDGYVLLSAFSRPDTVAVLMLGAMALGIAAVTALGHRFFATDCVTHYVRRLRAEKLLTSEPKDDVLREKAEKIVANEQVSLENDIDKCRWLLIVSSWSLVVGAFCVALSFALTLLAAA